MGKFRTGFVFVMLATIDLAQILRICGLGPSEKIETIAREKTETHAAKNMEPIRVRKRFAVARTMERRNLPKTMCEKSVAFTRKGASSKKVSRHNSESHGRT
jgi:methyl coenzyme M reductase subunit C-like uncharacterized protein (methanogenesis marker protein 7)